MPIQLLWVRRWRFLTEPACRGASAPTAMVVAMALPLLLAV